MGRRKAAGTRLEQARADHAEAERQIGKLEAARNDALLADRDDEAARLDAELEQLRRMVRVYRDKVQLLEGEAAREEAAERVSRHEAHIRQVEKLGDDFVAAGVKLAEAVANLVPAYRAAIAAAERRGMAWPWGPQDQGAAILSGPAVQAALSHEFFRCSHVPFLGGRPGEKLVPSLPGSKSSKVTELLGFPEKEPALVDTFREAVNYASRRMREISAQSDVPAPATPTNGAKSPKNGAKRSTDADADPAAKAEHPGAEPPAASAPPLAALPSERLARLLNDQAIAALDTTAEGERRYQQIVAEIATLQ